MGFFRAAASGPIYTPEVEKHHRICRLVCLLASQIMASAGCATVIPQDSLAQPAIAAAHDEPAPIPLIEQDVDADDEAEGPDASDATEPVHEQPEAPSSNKVRQMSAANHLGLAFALLRNGHHEAARLHFQAALDTGELNDAGRALVYWHIAATQRALGVAAAAQDALESFVVVSADLLAAQTRQTTQTPQDDDFVQRFELERRVARARAELSVAWAQQAGSFGRSAGIPVPVHNLVEMHYFLQLAPPFCPPGQPRRAYPAPGSRMQTQAGISEIQLSCEDSRVQETYFFVAEGGH